MARGQVRCGPWLLLQAVLLSRTDAWSPQPPLYKIKAGDGKKHISLYPQNGPVEVMLGDADWDKIQKDTDTVWIVELYDQGCPHCWYFSSLYPTVARAIKSKEVRVVAFNCIDPINEKACKIAMHFPTVMAYNLEAAGAAGVPIHVHKGEDIDANLRPKDIATMLSEKSKGRVSIVRPDVFPKSDGAGGKNLVDPSGPPGKDGWMNEGYGSVQSRFHDAHIGMATLLRDGYTSSKKYKAAIEVVKYIKRIYGKDEEKVFDALLAELRGKPDAKKAEFQTIMEEFMKQFNPKLVFCKTKTCAVWQLFHSISLLIAIHYTPVKVSEALAKYRFMVDEFMDCQVCREHFLKSYDECLFGRCSVGESDDKPKALVLWLWRLHNAVSMRVIREAMIKPEGGPIDRRWPAFKECPGCWKVKVVNGGKPGKLLTYPGQKNNDQPVYGVFREDKVYGYLLKSYLGEDPKDTRLFEDIPPLLKQSRVSGQWILTFSCAVASVTTLFAVNRFGNKLWKKSEASMDEQELLEAPEMVE